MQYKQYWADSILAATDGHVQITNYYSGVLAAPTDVADAVKGGSADIGWLFIGLYPGQFPLTDVPCLPMQGFGDNRAATETLWDLYDEYQAVRDEWSDFKILMIYSNPGNHFGSVKKPITKAADLKGLNMRTPAGPIATVMQAWGANPITIPSNEIYQSLERGVIDGWVWGPAGVVPFSVQEVTDYYTDMMMMCGTFALVMNKEKWESLPVEYQEIIDSYSLRTGSLGSAEAMWTEMLNGRDVIVDAGGVWVDVTAEDEAEFKIEGDKYAATWPDTFSADIDGAAYLEKAITLVNKYNAIYGG